MVSRRHERTRSGWRLGAEIPFTAYPERSGWGGDDLAVSGGPGLDGLLDQPGEAVADEGGGAAVEPEDVLVEVGGEVLLAHWATSLASAARAASSLGNLSGERCPSG